VIGVQIIGSTALGALTLSVLSTLLVFVVIPVAAIAVIGGLAYVGNDRTRRHRRYRPGRPYDFQPIWFLAAPERVASADGGAGHDGHALEPGSPRPELPSAVIEDSSGAPVRPGPTGGASDRW
jgi:hypothetical protein